MKRILVLIIIIIISLYYQSIIPKPHKNNYDLSEDGICIIRNSLNTQEMNELVERCNNDNFRFAKEMIISNTNLKTNIIKETGQDYEFHDYIFIIKKSAIHTCHRDANGSMFNDLKYPSYTMILYLEDMDKCLGVIPRSHKSNDYDINWTNQVQDVICKKGDILLFNANIIHTGVILEQPDNLRIQMKISHKLDIPKLTYYTNYNKIINESNIMPIPIQKIQQNISCALPILSNYMQSDIKNTTKYTQDSDIPLHHQLYSLLFYGKSNYYNLKNV
jgi:hypothetical protein